VEAQTVAIGAIQARIVALSCVTIMSGLASVDVLSTTSPAGGAVQRARAHGDRGIGYAHAGKVRAPRLRGSHLKSVCKPLAFYIRKLFSEGGGKGSLLKFSRGQRFSGRRESR